MLRSTTNVFPSRRPTYAWVPTYFRPEAQANANFHARLQREMPLGRLVGAREDAASASYLCYDAANCFVGQVFPVCGGWVMR